MSGDFRIPVALAPSGRLVAPDEAVRGSPYRCPQCEDTVDLHAGEIKRRHFHHRSARCSSESVLHLAAKRLIVQATADFIEGRAEAPVFVRTCACEGCEVTRAQPLPKKARRAVEEHGLASGHVADVVILGIADLPLAVIEVHRTHRVDEAKAFEIGVPWIEVDAEQVVKDGGRRLVPIRDRFVPLFCEEHTGQRGAKHRAVRDDRETRNQIARELSYRLTDFPGLRVEHVTRCNNGHPAFVFAWDGDAPPWPRPPEIVAFERERDWTPRNGRMRAVLPFRRAWRSLCHRCGAPLE